jgi:hypothetical protein
MQAFTNFVTYIPELLTPELATKLLGGSAIFLAYLFFLEVVRDRMTGVAGMLLTFPTLNGIGLLFAQSPDAQSKASSMMPMIPLNGVLFLISTTLLLDHLVCQNEDVMRHFDA